MGMMKCIVTFYEQAKKVIAESKGEKKVTWGLIYTQLDKQFYELTKLKFKVIQHLSKNIYFFKNLILTNALK